MDLVWIGKLVLAVRVAGAANLGRRWRMILLLLLLRGWWWAKT